MKKIVRSVKLVLFFIMMVFVIGSTTSCQNKKSSSEVRIIQAAHTPTNVPYGFLNDKGQSDGFEVSVLKAVDELLPQYEFHFNAVADDELLIGIETGKYQVGTKGAWLTEERKKKFAIPSNPIAASVIGLAYRSSNADEITDIDSFAAYSGKLIPISPLSAQYSVIDEYNKAHEGKPQIKLVPSDVFDIADSYLWVLEGRYDGYLVLKLSFEKNVLKETGPYHKFADELSFVPYKGIPTWPLFNKNETQLVLDYDAAIKTLQENGTISALSQKYFGENVFDFVTD
ncbi:MAG: transporter substrate-binding domain-containing protein [Treponema sp.]|nr:transporter substrate-binding domain-containing protein [Treponema sp.]